METTITDVTVVRWSLRFLPSGSPGGRLTVSVLTNGRLLRTQPFVVVGCPPISADILKTHSRILFSYGPALNGVSRTGHRRIGCVDRLRPSLDGREPLSRVVDETSQSGCDGPGAFIGVGGLLPRL